MADWPDDDLRGLFVQDKGAKKSSFDVNPKHVNDEVDADDMRPVEQVYAHWLRKHASANHTPVSLAGVHSLFLNDVTFNCLAQVAQRRPGDLVSVSHNILTHPTCMFEQLQLLTGKISHVVLRIKHKRMALERRLRLFYQLLESYIPDLKEVTVTPSSVGSAVCRNEYIYQVVAVLAVRFWR